MKGWLVDTNVIASLVTPNGAPSVIAWAESVDEDRLAISVLTLGEYDKGIAGVDASDPRLPRYIATREALERRFRGRVLSVSDRVVRLWGEISGRVKKETGHAPPVIDTLLAATAIDANLYLVTRNRKDVANSGAIVFDPWADDAGLFPIV